MTPASWTTFALLAAMFVMFVWNELPVWLVFITTLTAAMTSQLASPAVIAERL